MKNYKNSLDFLFFFLKHHLSRSGRKNFLLEQTTKKSFILLYQILMSNVNAQALKDAFMNIEKQFGKGAIMKMGDNANV